MLVLKIFPLWRKFTHTHTTLINILFIKNIQLNEVKKNEKKICYAGE